MSSSNFCNADLQSADFRGANLENIKVNVYTDWGPHFARQFRNKRKGELSPREYKRWKIRRYLGYNLFSPSCTLSLQ
jgi:hypothetical protein